LHFHHSLQGGFLLAPRAQVCGHLSLTIKKPPGDLDLQRGKDYITSPSRMPRAKGIQPYHGLIQRYGRELGETRSVNLVKFFLIPWESCELRSKPNS